MINIPYVHFYALVPFNTSSAVHLRPSADAGTHLKHSELFFGIAVICPRMICQRRPRSEKAHVSLYDIDQLRQLVNACRPKHFSHSGHTGIAVSGIDAAACVLGIVFHGAEFVHGKHLAAPADSFLTENSRTA